MFEIEFISKLELRSGQDDLRWVRCANVWSSEEDRDQALEWLALEDDDMAYRAAAP